MMIEIKKKREIVREIIEEGISEIIEKGVKSPGGRGERWCQCQAGRTEYAADVLASWIEDEDGDQAIDRLVTLIIY